MSKNNNRPTWDEYFIQMMDVVSKRATCDRGKSGCIITLDNHILVTGYVGSPRGLPHCDDIGHEIKKMLHDDGSVSEHCVRTIHAEQNAICQAAKLGIPLQGSTLYCRMTPCRICTPMIINCGIKRVVAERVYRSGQDSEFMMAKAGIDLNYVINEIQKYEGEDDAD